MSGRGKSPGSAKGRTSDPARARKLRDERVDHIVDAMASGSWLAADAISLAREWEVSLGAVQDYAREASGIIRRVVEGDPDAIRAELIAGIEALKKGSLGRRRSLVVRSGNHSYVEEVDDPDHKSALAAYELKAKLLGLITTKVQEIREPSNNQEAEALLAAAVKVAQQRLGR